MKPSGNRPRWRISSGVIAASLSQVTPAGNFTRTPPCTGFLPPDIMTPGIGWWRVRNADSTSPLVVP